MEVELKKEQMILTYEQAKELKFFCRSVVGTRQEFYKVMETVTAFDKKISKLEKTVRLIEDYFGEQLRPIHTEWNKTQENKDTATR